MAVAKKAAAKKPIAAEKKPAKATVTKITVKAPDPREAWSSSAKVCVHG